jgi:hypothetical protein
MNAIKHTWVKNNILFGILVGVNPANLELKIIYFEENC